MEDNVVNVSDRLEITEYADTEWKGQTPRAALLREVQVLVGQFECQRLKQSYS